MFGSDNSRKTPLGPSLNAIAAARAADSVFSQAREYPCKVESVNGQLVTVSFQVFGQPFAGTAGKLPNITVPIATSVYDWVPVQVGDLGMLKKSDVYLGGISGQGGGTANYTPRGNLSTLFYVPISNKAWKPPGGDANVRVVQGPDGVLLQNLPGDTTVLVKKDSAKITVQSNTIVNITSSGVTITVPSGDFVKVTAGGTLYPVVTTNGPSTVLRADG